MKFLSCLLTSIFLVGTVAEASSVCATYGSSGRVEVASDSVFKVEGLNEFGVRDGAYSCKRTLLEQQMGALRGTGLGCSGIANGSLIQIHVAEMYTFMGYIPSAIAVYRIGGEKVFEGSCIGY